MIMQNINNKNKSNQTTITKHRAKQKYNKARMKACVEQQNIAVSSN